MFNQEPLCKGMYVRCPLWDADCSQDADITNLHRFDDARYFYLGQIAKIIDDERVDVTCYDPHNIGDLFDTSSLEEREMGGPQEHMIFRITEIEPAYPRMGTIAYRDKAFRTTVKVVSLAKERIACDGGNIRCYYCTQEENGVQHTLLLREDELFFPLELGEVEPDHQMRHFEIQNPKWFLSRRVVSRFEHSLSNVPVGFSNLVGMPVLLFPHQVDAVIRAVEEEPCRLMLADEVGMGKTIEALAILKTMLDRHPTFRALLIVPSTLLAQWRSEIQLKFWLDVDNLATFRGKSSKQRQGHEELLLISGDEYQENYDSLMENPWDLLIVDEAHSVLAQNIFYQKLLQSAQKIPGILLLSATPVNVKDERMTSNPESSVDFIEQYYRLMMLLRPRRFADMNRESFEDLLNQQDQLQEIVNDIYFMLKDDDEDIYWDEIRDRLQELQEGEHAIHDDNLAYIIESYREEDPQQARKQAKYAIAYLSEFYRLDRGIIRHRRQEMESGEDSKTVRNLNVKNLPSEYHDIYPFGDDTFEPERQMEEYERNCYNQILTYAKEHCDTSLDIVKDLLTAVDSSPYAVLQVLDRHRLEAAELRESVVDWENSYEAEIRDFKGMLDQDIPLDTKMAQLTDALDQNFYDKKILIFTAFTANIEPLKRILTQTFGDEGVAVFAHHAGMHEEEWTYFEQEVARFQSDPDCRILISDESGGEGRNFQIADILVHYDLPWSPATMEQRIGRLDRIGRDHGRPVVSLVFSTKDSLEEQLLKLYDEGIHIFSESLCGLEIAFDRLQCEVDDALRADIRHGLRDRLEQVSSFMEELRDQVSVQMVYDIARNQNAVLTSDLKTLIQQFTQDDGSMLKNAMLAWTDMAGMPLHPGEDYDKVPVISLEQWRIHREGESIGRRLQHVFYRFPSEEAILSMRTRASWKERMTGTFSRQWAVDHEDIPFLAPYNVFFDSIINNAMANTNGRCTAMTVYQASLNWVGFVLTWNIHYNWTPLLEQNIDLRLGDRMLRYLPAQQPMTFCCLNAKYQNVSNGALKKELDILTDRKNRAQYEDSEIPDRAVVHLGRRTPEGYYSKLSHRYRIVSRAELPGFKHQMERYMDSFVRKAVNEGKGQLEKLLVGEDDSLVRIDQASEDLHRLATMSLARKNYYHDSTQQELSPKTIACLLQGLSSPEFSLDSIAFVQFSTQKPQDR